MEANMLSVLQRGANCCDVKELEENIFMLTIACIAPHASKDSCTGFNTKMLKVTSLRNQD